MTSNGATINSALTRAERILQRSASPRLDAEVLLAHVLKIERSWLLSHPEQPLGRLKRLRYTLTIQRRARGVPVAYLTHKKEFYGRTFYVNHHTLIPRPETELLVEKALATIRTLVPENPRPSVGNSSIAAIIDLATGSGCIAVTLALELPHTKIIASDISRTALNVARKNAALCGVKNRITFLHGNLLEPLLPYLRPATLLVANLPYILPREVQGDLYYEPKNALIGGNDGLKFYHQLAKQLLALTPASHPRAVLLELHPPTAQEVKTIFSQLGACQITTDSASLPRILTVTTAQNSN